MTVKNGIPQTWNLPEWWDGYRYSDTADRPVLSPPTTVDASAVVNDVTVTWVDTMGGIVQFSVERSSISSTDGFIVIGLTSAGATSIADAGRPAGTFWYRVRSYYNGTYSDEYSNTDSVVISFVPPVVDGDEVTITIPGGGSNVAASAQAFIGGYDGAVQTGVVGQNFSTNMPANWGQPGGSGPKFTSTRVLNGTRALVNDRTGGAFQFGMRYDHGSSKRVQFVRFSYYLDNPTPTRGQLKFVRFGGALSALEDTQQPNHYITWFDPNASSGQVGNQTYMPVNNSTLGGSNVVRYEDAGSTGNYYLSDTWVTIELYSRHNSDVTLSDGYVRLVARREDTGAVIADYTWSNQRLDYGGADRGRWLTIQLYMGNGFDNTCKLYIDRDVYISSSDDATPPKYILLGNRSTYAESADASTGGILTVCPYSSWSNVAGDANVTIRVNQGRHSSPTGLYAYGMSGPNSPINTTGVSVA